MARSGIFVRSFYDSINVFWCTGVDKDTLWEWTIRRHDTTGLTADGVNTVMSFITIELLES